MNPKTSNLSQLALLLATVGDLPFRDPGPKPEPTIDHERLRAAEAKRARKAAKRLSNKRNGP